jgi:hypothetical protein
VGEAEKQQGPAALQGSGREGLAVVIDELEVADLARRIHQVQAVGLQLGIRHQARLPMRWIKPPR